VATGRMKLGELGDFIREQRRGAQLSLRKLSDLAGISNPYLSQIERGLRKPSAEILQAIAKALRISAETLYVRAGILDEDRDHDLVAEILKDATISERQKQVLIDIYRSFKESGDEPHERAASVARRGVPHEAGWSSAPVERSSEA
jgi:transcriptional regulator with XRE-family HTH domain